MPGRANQSAGPPVRTVVSRASGIVALDAGRGRSSVALPSATSASPTLKTSPAPIVTSDAARAAGAAASAAARRSRVGAQSTGLPPIRSAAARAT